MNVLITGGAGYIGLELAYALSELPFVSSITMLDSLTRDNFNIFSGLRKFGSEKLNFVEDDILNNRTLERCVEEADVIYHLAAQVPSQHGSVSAHHFEQVNNWGCSCVADAIERYRTPKAVFNLSSMIVFGLGDINPDTDTPNPVDFYGVSKLRGERHFARLSNNTDHRVFTIRCGSVYGYSKNLRIDSSVNRMVFDANFRKRVQVKGDVDSASPHVYIVDLIRYMITFLEQDHMPGLYYAPSVNLSAHAVYDELAEIYPGLEVIFIDQGVYSQGLTLHDDFSPDAHGVTQGTLRANLEEFVKTFTFGNR